MRSQRRPKNDPDDSVKKYATQTNILVDARDSSRLLKLGADLPQESAFHTLADTGRAMAARGSKPALEQRPIAADVRIGARNRRAIVHAATRLFARKGFDGTRMSDIAADAGVPRPNVYYYFATKEDVYRAALGHLIEGWDQALTHIDARCEPGAALEAYVRAKLDYARTNVEESRLFATEVLRGAPFLTAADRAHMQNATRKASAVVESWVAAGRIKPVDPRHLFILLWSATQFYSNFEILAADALERPRLQRSDYDDAARTIVATVLHGIGG